jgi:DNA-binding NarL/FixJ family response regulator
MTRAFIADTRAEERSALHLLLQDLNVEVVGEAADWETTLTELPASCSELLLVDWDMLPAAGSAALDELRRSCPVSMAVVLISCHDARRQAALSSGADVFISTSEMAERVAERFRAVTASVEAGESVA